MDETPDIQENAYTKKSGIRSVAINFYLYAFGVLLIRGPYFGVIGLQSSVNIKGSIGTSSLGVAYALSAIFAVVCTPSVIHRFGCRRTTIVGEITYLIYIAANFYPASYTMIPGGLTVGIGEALIWTAIPMYCIFYGKRHGQYGSKPFHVYSRKYTGVYFAMFQFSQVFGNLLGYAVLYGWKQGKKETMVENSTMLPIIADESTSNYNETHFDRYQFCGANDCQNSTVTSAHIDQYVPADSFSLILLLGLYCCIGLIGISIHIRFLPEITKLVMNKDPDEELDSPTTKVSLPTRVVTTVRATCRHMVNTKQVLMISLLFYIGTFTSFIPSELNRAYTSCMLGVEQVGLAMIIFATTSGLTASMSEKLLEMTGRSKLIATTCIVDCVNYAFCWLWRPHNLSDEVWPVYLIYFVFGLTDGLWKPMSIDAYSKYFPRNSEIAFSVWNFWITLGIAAQFCWSPLMCVRSKICIQITLLAFSILFYGIAEKLDKRRTQNEETMEVRCEFDVNDDEKLTQNH